jgi:hypothetical protein
MLFIYDLFKKNGRARIFNYTGYLAEYVKTHRGDNYTMRIYSLYRYTNGISEDLGTHPSYKLWKQIAYDLHMPGMTDKTWYKHFKHWYDTKVDLQFSNSYQSKTAIPIVSINGLEYKKLPDDKEEPFTKYGGPFCPVREVISGSVISIQLQNGATIVTGEVEEEDIEEEHDDIPF